jgi:hypothetical protein
MKTLINIAATVYDENGKVTHAYRSFSFIRPRSAKKPTFTGAARMVAKELDVKPSDVSVAWIEALAYQTR